MNTIEESINEFDEVEKIVYKVPLTFYIILFIY